MAEVAASLRQAGYTVATRNLPKAGLPTLTGMRI
jgi:hypothetical protein